MKCKNLNITFGNSSVLLENFKLLYDSLKQTHCSDPHYKIYFSNGIQISHKIAHATGKAKKKGIEKVTIIFIALSSFVAVVKVQKWVVNLTFSTLAIPLVLLAFVFLLHPHREIQAGPLRLSKSY